MARKKVMNIVWVSRHNLTEKNIEIMRKAFGEFGVFQFKDNVNDVKDLVKFADKVKADAYIVVLPPHIIQQLMFADKKRPVFRFVVDRKVKKDGSVEFKPVGLEQILRIEVVTKRIV